MSGLTTRRNISATLYCEHLDDEHTLVHFDPNHQDSTPFRLFKRSCYLDGPNNACLKLSRD